MLTIQHLTKIFFKGSVDEVVALHDISFELAPGEFATIIGSNGAGKSTLLNVIPGVFGCDEGRIVLDGDDITTLPEHRRAGKIGRVYQDPRVGTASSMSIEENLSMALLRGQRRSLGAGVNNKGRAVFREALAPLGLGLENRLGTSIGTLSGGQRQALALIMATISDPCLLLLDEHTASLDPKTGSKILALTADLVERRHLTTLMVTHNMEHAIRFGNRLIMMHQGQIVLDIDAAEKSKLTVADLIARFESQSHQHFADDRVLLNA